MSKLYFNVKFTFLKECLFKTTMKTHHYYGSLASFTSGLQRLFSENLSVNYQKLKINCMACPLPPSGLCSNSSSQRDPDSLPRL